MEADRICDLDCSINNWPFPIWNVDFGCGAPVSFQGKIEKASAFTCTLIPDQQDGGFFAAVVVPASVAANFRASEILRRISPDATWL